jgi:ATP-dependent RNA helicase RhlB
MLRRFIKKIRDGLKKPVPAEKPVHHRPDEPRRDRPKPPAPHAARPHSHPAPKPPAAQKPWDPSLFQVPPKEGATRFQDLDLPVEIMHAIADLGFQYCTPIQAAILPKTLLGVDAAGRAQTGTGKTAAFLIGLFTRLLRNPPAPGRRAGSPRVLILAPTRELVMQIEQEAKAISRYCPFYTMAVFGGVDFDKQQKQLINKNIDVMVATPGRLLDFHQRHILHLNRVEVLVIDEADRMLDMGFIPDVRRIVNATPPKTERQTLLFSATLTDLVLKLTAQWTRDPVMVEIEPEHVAGESVEQVTYIITAAEKFNLLYNLLTKRCKQSTLIFANRRDEARELTDRLRFLGIRCALLSGEVPQEKRIRVLRDFKEGKIPVVVATDVAARGIHVEGIGHVINYNLPDDAEDYVHRIGRTGRAGATGVSISFACEEDSFWIPAIEKYLGHDLKCTQPEPELVAASPASAHGHALRPRSAHPPRRPGGRGRPQRGRGGPRR